MEQIAQRVAVRVAEVLALEPAEVQAEHRLMADLGADSLDLVELMYLLEQEFGIELDQKDVSLSAQLGLTDEEIHDREVLTPRALELLRQRFPEAGELLEDGATRNDLANLLTVTEIARAIERKVASQAGQPG